MNLAHNVPDKKEFTKILFSPVVMIDYGSSSHKRCLPL